MTNQNETKMTHTMNRRGLKALARELLQVFRPEIAEHLKWECGAYLRDVGKSRILAEWAYVCEVAMDGGVDTFEVGSWRSRTGKPVSIDIDPDWFDVSYLTEAD